MAGDRTAISRIILYLFLLLLPIFVTTSALMGEPENFYHNLGRAFALIGFVILALQFTLAARLHWLERPFGLNLVFPFHRNMAILALLLLLSHPFLLAYGEGSWKLLASLNMSWYIWVGRLTLLTLLLNVFITLVSKPLKVPFENWRLGHNFSGPAIVIMAFIHSWNVGTDLALPYMRVLWVLLFFQAVVLYLYHRFFLPRRLRRYPYRVVDVQQETHNVWTLKFAPPEGQERFDFVPGQFQFVTLLRERGLPVEEHHFTISSSPTEPDFHTSTIKASGDFTATIGQTRPGDLAAIEAPFGRFSSVYYQGIRDFIYIAGGIGITPLMSNLRYMHAIKAEHRILLLYANRTEADIIFQEELACLEVQPRPELTVVHILSRPGESWEGEKGHLDRDTIKRLAGERLKTSMLFLCCPYPMLKQIRRILSYLGVPEEHISFEYFSLR
jgi:predicted ferric reductase